MSRRQSRTAGDSTHIGHDDARDDRIAGDDVREDHAFDDDKAREYQCLSSPVDCEQNERNRDEHPHPGHDEEKWRFGSQTPLGQHRTHGRADDGRNQQRQSQSGIGLGVAQPFSNCEEGRCPVREPREHERRKRDAENRVRVRRIDHHVHVVFMTRPDTLVKSQPLRVDTFTQAAHRVGEHKCGQGKQ